MFPISRRTEEAYARHRASVYNFLLRFYIEGIKLHQSGGNWFESSGTNRYRGTYTLFPDEPLPEEFELGLEMTRLGTYAIKGDWRFAIPVTNAKSGNRMIAMHHPIFIGESMKLEVDTILLTPTSTTVTIRSRENEAKLKDIAFYLLDETGQLHLSNKRSSYNETDGWKFDLMFGAIPLDSENLTLIPHKDPLDHPRKIDLSQDLPIRIDTDLGGIEITDLKLDGQNGYLEYETDSAYAQFPQFSLHWEDGSSTSMLRPTRLSENPYRYRWEFGSGRADAKAVLFVGGMLQDWPGARAYDGTFTIQLSLTE